MKLNVVKIGGNVIDNSEALNAFLDEFAKMEAPKILIHGGGVLASNLSKKLGIEPKMIDGRRVTDEQTIDIVTMVYAGLINKKIVAALQAKGCNALGLSGADGNVIKAVKRPPVPIDYGFVGDIYTENINAPLIATLLNAGICPVFSAINHDGSGNLLNTNADTMASSISVAMSNKYEVALHFNFEKKGVLSNPDDDDSVIDYINSEKYAELISSGIISGGMIPKLENAFKALKNGVKSVNINNTLIEL